LRWQLIINFFKIDLLRWMWHRLQTSLSGYESDF
jgi:hypothetical protein